MTRRAGVALALLQFAFALTWVVYATFLPALAAQVGVARELVPWILVADQAIFLICDWLAGVFADRIGDAVVRLGRWIAVVTVISCGAFVALPVVAPDGSQRVLGALMLVWSATSSMLRAPPLALAGRFASRPQRAWLASAYTLGLAAAAAVAPYVGRAVAALDPRIPFAVASGVVAATTIIVAALPQTGTAVRSSAEVGQPRSLGLFAVALVILAAGLQINGSFTAAAIYLRYATLDQIGDLMPVFWIGCAIGTLPAAPLIRRAGGLVAMIGGAVIGAAALAIAEVGGSLIVVIAAQAVAGAAWGVILSGAFGASAALERRGGAATGLIFSVLAAATLARIAVTTTGAAASIGEVVPLTLVPSGAWVAAAIVVAVLAFRRRA